MHAAASVSERIAQLDWAEMTNHVDRRGFVSTPTLLAPDECAALVALYDSGRFRKRVEMGRHQYGEGEYKYFDAPLPPLVAELRAALYIRLAPVANHWGELLRHPQTYPATLDEFVAQCHARGQVKPTPLLLRYEQGGYNCLHQDLYGAIAFPFQAVIVLSKLGEDYQGGDFLLVEQRPRAQSRGESICLDQGQALLFTNRHRPVAGARGHHRVLVRHGVSTLLSGRRYSLGIIFHDAE